MKRVRRGHLVLLSKDHRYELQLALKGRGYKPEKIRNFINYLEMMIMSYAARKKRSRLGSDEKDKLDSWIGKYERARNHLKKLSEWPIFYREELLFFADDVQQRSRKIIEDLEGFIQTCREAREALKKPGKPKEEYKWLFVAEIARSFGYFLEKPSLYSGPFEHVIGIALEAIGESSEKRDHRRIIKEVLKKYPFRSSNDIWILSQTNRKTKLGAIPEWEL